MWKHLIGTPFFKGGFRDHESLSMRAIKRSLILSLAVVSVFFSGCEPVQQKQTMKYQLVLQWSDQSVTYDKLISIEEALIEKLSEAHEVDGHDSGSGSVNIFILTNDPRNAFNQVRSILGEHTTLWRELRAAFRDVKGDDYTILWPEGSTSFDVI